MAFSVVGRTHRPLVISFSLQSYRAPLNARHIQTQTSASSLCIISQSTSYTMGTITAPPTLTASWQPTGSGCLSSADYWIWDYGQDDSQLVLGGPSQTTDCLPTSWGVDVVFNGEDCPHGYTSACRGADSRGEVTCCPRYVVAMNPSSS